MARLPEKIRKTLEKVVAELRIKENVYGIALFGSWSRDEAAASSDIDLLILDKSNFNYEYVERVESSGLFIDLDHVPKRWIHGLIPPEIDQKLYEMQILYDRDWSLNNTKLLMVKSYVSPERVDIRTEAHVVESDIYLSRATSAYAREDFQSAQLFAITALENILKVLIEIALEPLSNSRFLDKFEFSAAKFGMSNLLDEYLDVTGLREADVTSIEERLRLFELIWNEMKDTVEHNSSALESSHFKVKTKLNYFLNSAFLRGMIQRTNGLIDSGKVAEATRYMVRVFLDIVENYVWLKSLIDNVKVDYTLLMHSLERLERKSPRNYGHIVEFLQLDELDRREVFGLVEKIREIMFRIRGERKVLIENHLIRG